MELSMRVRVAVVIIFLASVFMADPAEATTEAEVIRLFLDQSPRAAKVPLAEQSAGAGLRVEARVANPDVAYQVEDALGVRDEFLTFQQELPINGRRGLLKDGAQAASLAAGLEAERDLQSAAHAVRMSFYEVLYRKRALDRLANGVAMFQQLIDILARREREGEGSGYDLLRAEQELADIGIASGEAEAALAVARARFGSFFGADLGMETVELDGDFESNGEILQPDEAIEMALSQRLDYRALLADADRLDLERRAARRRRYPEPTLLAGWKRTEALGFDDTGFIASVTLPLPVFDHGRVTARRATADRQRVELDAELLTREIRAEVLGALAREEAARETAKRYGVDVERRAGELRRIAQLGYDEGENGILELLDAHRTSLAIELRALAVRYEAKKAEIDRDRAIGAEVKP